MIDFYTVDIDGVGAVLFERSKRAKHVIVSVKPFTGVRVAVPHGLSFNKAEEFVHAKTDWIQKCLARLAKFENKIKIGSAVSADIDKEKVKRKLTRRLKHLAKKYGFTYNRVLIRNQKTRWGSCSHQNNINLNMKIINLPEELMDYVILHELIHTRFKNHGNDFWSALNKLVGNGKGLALRLREYGIGLL